MTNYITKEEVLAIFREHKPVDFVEVSEYNSPESECPMCGEVKNINGPVFCTDKCVFESIQAYFESKPEKEQEIAKIYAIKNSLAHGETIKFFQDGYRNDGLYFWDNKRKEIVLPFDEIDDYGSVPPRFVVDPNGEFPLDRWLNEVVHNSYVFPSIELIDKIKEAVKDIPNNNNDKTITIDDIMYTYNKNTIKNGWDSIILEVDSPETAIIYPGFPEWRDKYTNAETKQRKRKTNVMHELKEQLHMAPPMPGLSEGGPGYQAAKESFEERRGRGGKKQKIRKTRKLSRKLNRTKKSKK